MPDLILESEKGTRDNLIPTTTTTFEYRNSFKTTIEQILKRTIDACLNLEYPEKD